MCIYIYMYMYIHINGKTWIVHIRTGSTLEFYMHAGCVRYCTE